MSAIVIAGAVPPDVIARIRAEMESGSVQLLIPDFNPLASNAASVALAKHMLESACKKPMLVKSVKSVPIQSLSSSA